MESTLKECQKSIKTPKKERREKKEKKQRQKISEKTLLNHIPKSQL